MSRITLWYAGSNQSVTGHVTACHVISVTSLCSDAPSRRATI